MRKKTLILSIILQIIGLAIFSGLNAKTAKAAVPVWVVGFDKCTDYQTSLENFMFNLAKSIEEKHEDFLKSFELAKIEKAREDINKLTFETLKEIKEEPIIYQLNPEVASMIKRTMGLKISDKLDPKHCPGGFLAEPTSGPNKGKKQCIYIVKEGRVIQSLEDYIHYEPILKARHFVNCYLGKHHHFPFSDKIRDELRNQILGTLVFKPRYIINSSTGQGKVPLFPGWGWYYASGESEDKYTAQRCKFMMSFLPTTCESDKKNVEGCFGKYFTSNTEENSPENNKSENEKSENNKKDDGLGDWSDLPLLKPSLNKGDLENNEKWEIKEWWDKWQKSSDKKNNPDGVANIALSTAQEIIDYFSELRKLEYTAGQGLRPEKYLVGWYDDQQDSPTNGYLFFYDTEYVIEPAFVLRDKMKATIQAQFDLAQKAYKYPPDQKKEAKYKVKGCEDKELKGIKPSVEELAAPWEDKADYAKIPENYKKAREEESKEPKDLGKDYYLNQFYLYITEMYEFSFGDILDKWFKEVPWLNKNEF